MKGITSSKTFTGSSGFSVSINPQEDFYLDDIRVHLPSVGVAGTLTVILNSSKGSMYNVVLVSQDMTSIADLVYQPDSKSHFLEGDFITVAWANASNLLYGVEFVYTIIREVF